MIKIVLLMNYKIGNLESNRMKVLKWFNEKVPNGSMLCDKHVMVTPRIPSKDMNLSYQVKVQLNENDLSEDESEKVKSLVKDKVKDSKKEIGYEVLVE